MRPEASTLDAKTRERIHEYAHLLAEQAPPLTAEQRDELRVVFAGPRRPRKAGQQVLF